MAERKFNEVFSRRLRYYMERDDINQVELANRLGVGKTSVYNWVNGIKTPRMDKVDAMCKIFGCSRSDLINEETSKESSYYFDPAADAAADFLHKQPEYNVLFDSVRKIKPEDIDFVKKMIDRVSGQSGEGSDNDT